MKLHRVSHSLITVFQDTSEGGPSDVLLQQNGSAILQQDKSYILLSSNYPSSILLQQNGASLRQQDGSRILLRR